MVTTTVSKPWRLWGVGDGGDAYDGDDEVELVVRWWYRGAKEMVDSLERLTTRNLEWYKIKTIYSGNLGSLLLEMENPWSLITLVSKRSNDIRTEKTLTKSANPLALLAAAQPYSDNYYQEPKPQKSNAPSYKQSSSTRSSATSRHKGKEIAKPVTPHMIISEEDSDQEQD
ncbi:hypothetical protein Tco_0682970 [Tanacetum coccineum]|uniref:Uncharacterized protein n=1 Tax=Tanacetum coccineum TaxID=301880 RepID=A0ABQ4XTS3_9ASTR